MDLFDELERMALNSAPNSGAEATDKIDADEATIRRWKRLFLYSRADAVEAIEQWRGDLSRTRVSDEHWDLVRTKKSAEGYDREAYDHELEIGGRRRLAKAVCETQSDVALTLAQARAIYLLKLQGPLDTVHTVQAAAKLAKLPAVVEGTGDDGDASFCRVNGRAKQTILNWLSAQNTSFRPTFVQLRQPAEKDFSSHSMHPTLGVDATLPQHRPNDEGTTFFPTQGQYPVWYFFYGSLADPDVLSMNLSLPTDQPPIFHAATVKGGVLTRWGSKYWALVDGPSDATVKGVAYRVFSRDHEDSLRSYETDNYEVVRCTMTLGLERMPGCTLRFIGAADTTERLNL